MTHFSATLPSIQLAARTVRSFLAAWGQTDASALSASPFPVRSVGAIAVKVRKILTECKQEGGMGPSPFFPAVAALKTPLRATLEALMVLASSSSALAAPSPTAAPFAPLTRLCPKTLELLAGAGENLRIIKLTQELRAFSSPFMGAPLAVEVGGPLLAASPNHVVLVLPRRSHCRGRLVNPVSLQFSRVWVSAPRAVSSALRGLCAAALDLPSGDARMGTLAGFFARAAVRTAYCEFEGNTLRRQIKRPSRPPIRR